MMKVELMLKYGTEIVVCKIRCYFK